MSDRSGAPPGVPLPLNWDVTSPGSRIPRKPDHGPKIATRGKDRSPSQHVEKGPDLSVPRPLTAHILSELQEEVARLETERGTAAESLGQKSLILSEEAFEVLKLLRRRAGIATARVPRWSLDDELVDLLFVAAAMANRIPVRLETLWLNEGDDEVAATSTGYDPDAVLTAVLDMSQQVLRVIGICHGLATSPGHNHENDLEKGLASLLRSISHIAVVSGVDLRRAVDGKLMRDQLRLWST